MRQALKTKIERAFALTVDLVEHTDEVIVGADLPHQPSNRMSRQFWCVVGSRESLSIAIEGGGWRGSSCSMKAPGDTAAVLAALRSSAERLLAIDFEPLSDRQFEFAFELLEHDVQHHGQLIR